MGGGSTGLRSVEDADVVSVLPANNVSNTLPFSLGPAKALARSGP